MRFRHRDRKSSWRARTCGRRPRSVPDAGTACRDRRDGGTSTGAVREIELPLVVERAFSRAQAQSAVVRCCPSLDAPFHARVVIGKPIGVAALRHEPKLHAHAALVMADGHLVRLRVEMHQGRARGGDVQVPTGTRKVSLPLGTTSGTPKRASARHETRCVGAPAPVGLRVTSMSAEAHAVDGRQVVADDLPMFAAVFAHVQVARGAAKGEGVTA